MVPSRLPVDVYVRVSRVGKRGERLISPDEQERRARQLANERSLRIGIVLTDLDESGGKWERPGLQEALRRVRARESGGMIVAWLDRLSRDSEHAHRLVREIDDAGGAIYAPDAPSDWTTPEGELQAGILFAFATYVRKRAAVGFERAKAQAIERGIPVHTRPPVGYRRRKDPDPLTGERGDPRLTPDENAARVVRELFERRAQGAGPAELGRILEAAAVRTSQGSVTWSRQAIYGLLSNRVYLGELRYGRDGRYVNAAAHDPIVDLATWTAAQRPRIRPGGPTRSQRHEFLLTGLLRCAACRYCVQATTTSRNKRIYRCTRTHAGGVCGAPVRVDAAKIEQRATEAFWALAEDLTARGTDEGQDGVLASLEDALERAERALKQWMAPDVQEAIGDIAEYATGLRARRQSRDKAASELGDARAAAAAPALSDPRVATLRDDWQHMTFLDRREMLRALLECVTLSRDPAGLVVYPAGTAPGGLPRRGYKRTPVLEPFPADLPDGARMLTL